VLVAPLGRDDGSLANLKTSADLVSFHA
jgi:hypothetical protein